MWLSLYNGDVMLRMADFVADDKEGNRNGAYIMSYAGENKA